MSKILGVSVREILKQIRQQETAGASSFIIEAGGKKLKITVLGE